MAQRTIFYSWQSDLPNNTNRGFIERCLEKAINELKSAHPILDSCLDRDTADVPGSPDIAATILDKIDNCSVFVCDVSIVQSGQRPTPNPNVVFELGYAVRRLGWERVICIANTHFGNIESLPFDVRQRRVKNFTLAPEAADRTDVSKTLTSVLRSELELILTMPQDEGERLQLHFANTDTRTPLGKSLRHSTVYYAGDLDKVPDYNDDDDGNNPFGAMAVRVGRINRDYNRQMIQFVQHSLALRKIGFVVFNGNKTALNDLTMEIVLRKAQGLIILDDEPARPSQSETDMMMRSITPIASHFARPGKLTLHDLPDRYEIRVEFGKVQAEANAWTDPIYIGTSEPATLSIPVSLYADELGSPAQVVLELGFDVTRKTVEEVPGEDLARLLSNS